jgi:hypothetical protein
VGAVVAVTLASARRRARPRRLPGYEDLPQGHPLWVHRCYHRTFSEANVLTIMIEARAGTIHA